MSLLGGRSPSIKASAPDEIIQLGMMMHIRLAGKEALEIVKRTDAAKGFFLDNELNS